MQIASQITGAVGTYITNGLITGLQSIWGIITQNTLYEGISVILIAFLAAELRNILIVLGVILIAIALIGMPNFGALGNIHF